MRDVRHHDLVIIGTGSGNSILDERFADWDVAIVERNRFGGTCLNVGCVPTKMYVHTADLAATPADGRPVVSDVPGLDEVPYQTSDTIMRMEAPPRRLVILGNGFVAAEFAHIFGAFGVDVTVIARSDRLLRAEDESVSRRFTELAGARWDVRLGQRVRGAERDDGVTRLRLDGPDGECTAEAEELLVAVGRRPNSDLLHVAAGGIATHPDGRIAVDEYQRTGVDGVWALGDICSEHQLKHVANHETRVVQHNLLHPDAPVAADHRFVPHAVLTAPQIAAVGLTEQAARERGVPYAAGSQDYAGVAYGWALEDTTGFAKVLADPSSGRLLGAHVIGPQASTLIQPLIQAMSFEQDVRELARGQYWIHPALPELVENALLNLAMD